MSKARYGILDLIRGIALINMIAYHTLWDLVYLFDKDIPFYTAAPGRVWQQFICCSFIVLSGFCLGLGRPSYRRGLTVFLSGGLVTAVTLIFMPGSRIVFGILTFLGSAMLLCRAAKPLLKRCPPPVGCILSLGLFILTRSIRKGYIGVGSLSADLPEALYSGYISAFCGFPSADFFSADYFPLFPWLFLFLFGFFLFDATKNRPRFSLPEGSLCRPLELMGRYSLYIYLAHQPLIYLILSLIYRRFP